MEEFAVVSVFVSIVVLIIFLVMAANVATIKNATNLILLNQKITFKYYDSFLRGEIKEYLGKNEDALEAYNEAFFLLQKHLLKNQGGELEKKHLELIKSKIVSLGGIPRHLQK